MSGINQRSEESTRGNLLVEVIGADGTAIGNTTDKLKVDGSAVTQPVSGTVTANAGTGNFTVVQATGTNLHAVIDSGTIAATQSGTWNINNVSGTVSLPTGAATSANQTSEITALQIIDDLPHAQNAALVKGVPMMGQLDDTSTTSATEDNVAVARITAKRAVHVNLRNNAGTEMGTSNNPFYVLQDSANDNISYGDVALSLIGQNAVRRTTYTEQTTNAQRSISSSSVLDTGSGTGAQQVTITYYDSTGAGPSTETITLNGVTNVNTVSSTICFIEKMVVARVGSGGSNAGTITLHAGAAGAGVVIGTIQPSDNMTFWAHHYVASNLTLSLSSVAVNHSGSTVGSGGLYIIKAQTLGVTGAPELQITDFIRLFGQEGETTRDFNSAIEVVGPARLLLYVTPETASLTTYRGSFGYEEF